MEMLSLFVVALPDGCRVLEFPIPLPDDATRQLSVTECQVFHEQADALDRVFGDFVMRSES